MLQQSAHVQLGGRHRRDDQRSRHHRLVLRLDDRRNHRLGRRRDGRHQEHHPDGRHQEHHQGDPHREHLGQAHQRGRPERDVQASCPDSAASHLDAEQPDAECRHPYS